MAHFHPPDSTSRHLQPWILSSFLYISRAQAREQMGQVSAGASEPAAQGLPDQVPPVLSSSLLLDLNGFSVRQAASHCAVTQSMWQKERTFSLPGHQFRPQNMFSELIWILWVQDKVPPGPSWDSQRLEFPSKFSLVLEVTQARENNR